MGAPVVIEASLYPDYETMPWGLRHRSAIVMPWVSFTGGPAIVHPFAVVGRMPDQSRALARAPMAARDIAIGGNARIGCHAVVYADTDIGEDCLIGDFALIREGARIGDRCVIGCHVSISYDSEIAEDCRFQNGTVFHGGAGAGCFFGVGVICSSDRRVDLVDYRFRCAEKPIFGKRVMVGSGANIVAGARIGDGAVIASGALIVSDVPAGAVMMGPKAAPFSRSVQHHSV